MVLQNLFRQMQICLWLWIGVILFLLGNSTLTAQITFTPNITSGITTTAGAIGFAWGDYDGDLDLYVGGAGSSSVLYQNNGDGTFTSVSYTPPDPTAYTLLPARQ